MQAFRLAYSINYAEKRVVGMTPIVLDIAAQYWRSIGAVSLADTNSPLTQFSKLPKVGFWSIARSILCLLV